MTDLERKLLLACAHAVSRMCVSDTGIADSGDTAFGFTFDEDACTDVCAVLYEYKQAQETQSKESTVMDAKQKRRENVFPESP